MVLRTAEQSKWKVSNYCSTNRIMNWAALKSLDISGAYNNVPSQQWYWRVFADASSIATNSYIGMDVKITYYCRLFKENTIDES